MKKLLQGILDFRKRVRPTYRETFADESEAAAI
jgi:hypothetical protein